MEKNNFRSNKNLIELSKKYQLSVALIKALSIISDDSDELESMISEYKNPVQQQEKKILSIIEILEII